ncbi:hypothetical protein K7640_27300 [Micromonospora sp. PLK6-60]|uniref:hypothetical protein n=1 Tax=Micromonospora sp. PLK6-60 TaxID=2873383 RepID=UPI001CA69328|nr:hypothetical protein [Micromonospora sp. PLK6-60]MBY8875544.1 hypothetical protein [Micromonospora sp. PLK6-60]
MPEHLAVLLPIAGAWVAAGVVAERLPTPDLARVLRQRTAWLLGLTLTGLGLTAGVLAAGLQSPGGTPYDQATAGLALAVLPALAVAICTVRRVRRLRAGAGALAGAPGTPAPHGLRAAAAHPLIVLPVQLTALATVPAVLSASGLDLFTGPGVTGAAVTVGVLGALAIGVRHALRHSRLAERVAPAESTSARAASPLHV